MPSHEQMTKHFYDSALIYRLLKYLHPYRLWLGIALGFLVIAKGIDAAVPIFIGRITNRVLASYSDPMPSHVFEGILYSCLGVISLIIFSYFFEAITVFIKSKVAQKGLYALRAELFQHIERLPMSFYDHSSIGNLITRTIHDVEQINQMFTEGVVPILSNMLLFLGIFIGIFILDWRVGIVLSIVLPFVVVLTHRFRISQRRCYVKVRSIISAMNAFAQEHLMGISTIRHFGLQERERGKFEKINRDHCVVNIESVHHFSFFIAGIEFLQNVALILSFVVLVALAPAGTGFHAGTFFSFSLYALMFFRPLGDLAERYNMLQSAVAAAERIFNILDEPEEPAFDEGIPLDGDVDTLAFEDVWFAYEKENWVLRGVTFQLHKGESLALVGMSGSGKTSVINLLLRLYDYQKGSIRINGRDIKDYSIASLRRCFSVILQDPVIFSGTIEDNVALYDSQITQKQVEASVDYVNLGALINGLPQKLQHPLQPRGMSLSVGERQLLSLARAIAHHRSVLIFDEATANIDLTSEKRMREALHRILKGRTAIIIAHRLSTIRDCSKILVLHQGRVAEMGRHDELTAAKGIYAKFYRLN